MIPDELSFKFICKYKYLLDMAHFVEEDLFLVIGSVVEVALLPVDLGHQVVQPIVDGAHVGVQLDAELHGPFQSLARHRHLLAQL